MGKKSLLFLLLLLVPYLLSAQSINLEARSDAFVYLTQSEHENAYIEGQIRLDFRAGSKVFIYLKPHVRYGSRFVGNTFAELYERELRPILNLDEGYIGIERDNFRLKLGKLKQEICLSTRSPVCPEDSFNPRDFIDPFRGFDERVGLPSISVELGDRRQYLRVIRSFGNSFSKMPIQNSRWYSGPEGLSVLQNTDTSENLSIAGRISFRRSSLGLVVSRVQDYSPYAMIIASEDSMSPPSLVYNYPRRTSAILQAEFYRKIITRFSGGYVHENDFESIQYSLEFESQKLESWRTLSVLGGLIGEISLSDKQGFVKSDPLSWRRGFNNSFYGGFEQTTDSWCLYFGVVATLEKDVAYAVNPKITYTGSCVGACDFFEIRLSGLFLNGESNTFFGKFRKNNRVGLTMLFGF